MTFSTRFFTTFNGASIAYTVTGNGPPLVVPPPFMSNLALMAEAPWFVAMNDALSEHFTVVHYDRYGCGLSDRERTDFSQDVDFQILCDLVAFLELPRLVLLGVSDGGYSAVRFAATWPERVSHLMLFGCGLYASEASARVLNAVHRLIEVDARVGTNALYDWLLPDGTDEQRRWFSRLTRESASPRVVAGLGTSQGSIDYSTLLRQIAIPTLVMNRHGDRVTSVDEARKLASLIPGAEIVVVPGTSHIAEFGDTRPIRQAYIDFVFGSTESADWPPPLLSERFGCLTAREAEVLVLLADGLSNREIGDRLSVSVHTVERHLTTIYDKLDVRGRSAATALVHRTRLA